MALEYTIYCDQCGELIDASRKSASEARRRAITEGTLKKYNRKEYCPICYESIFDVEPIDFPFSGSA